MVLYFLKSFGGANRHTTPQKNAAGHCGQKGQFRLIQWLVRMARRAERKGTCPSLVECVTLRVVLSPRPVKNPAGHRYSKGIKVRTMLLPEMAWGQDIWARSPLTGRETMK